MKTNTMRRLLLASLIGLFGLGAAGLALAEEGTPPDLPAGQTAHYGAEFSSEGEAITLTEAMAQCVDSGQPCKIAATVGSVCQRRGCWFTLNQEGVDSNVRIRMLDYGFFVPVNAAGAAAIVEGTLQQVEITQEMAQHYADDEAAATGQPAAVIDGPVQGYEITATGVQLTQPAAN